MWLESLVKGAHHQGRQKEDCHQHLLLELMEMDLMRAGSEQRTTRTGHCCQHVVKRKKGSERLLVEFAHEYEFETC